MPGRRDVWLLLLLLATHLYFANEFRAFPNTNVRSRVYLTLAIVDDHSLSIDGCVRRYGATQDMAAHSGRLYSDKAPGYSLLLVPIAWVLRQTVVPIDDIRGMSILLRVFGLSLPTVVFWYALRRHFAALAGGDRRGAAVVVAGALGTNFFIYATQLFAHATAGMLLYLAYRAVDGRVSARRAAGIAALLGLAFTIDYVVAPAAAAIALWTVIRSRGRLAAVLAATGSMAAIGLAWTAYNSACFGAPFTVGFHEHIDPRYGEAYRRGLAGIQWPDATALLGATVLPPHGTGFLSPFLLLAPIGWWRMAREPASRGMAIVCAAVCVLSLTFVSTLVDWRGGWSVSVRYLVPTIPFALEGVAAAIAPREARAARFVFVAGALIGIVQTALAAATFPDFPPTFRDPCFELAVPLLLHGCVNGTLWNSAASPAELIPFAVLCAIAIVWVARASTVDKPRRRIDLRPLAVAGAIIAAQVPLAFRLDYERRLKLADVLEKMGYACQSDAERAKLHGETLAKDPDNLFELTQLAWIRAASPCDELRNGPEAVSLAERASAAAPPGDPDVSDVLAAAYAEAGRWEDARHVVRSELIRIHAAGETSRTAQLRERLRAYELDRPYRRAATGR